MATPSLFLTDINFIQAVEQRITTHKLHWEINLRLIEREIVNEIGGLILKGQLKLTHVVDISVEGDSLVLKRLGAETM